MTPRSLQAVFLTLAAGMPATDAELLGRHLDGDEHAFGELVRRHGRLVWSACRHLTRSAAEADDAFQATFLVLLKNARKVREPAKLSCWLHGAAYKVCANARKASARRAAREKAAAAPEGNGHAVPQAAWDRTLAAVHQEVAALPETQRVPFEAAQRLGWKVGTLTSRLTRAKDAVLARLDARGLAVGAVAGIGLVTPPTAAVARAAALAHAGTVVPASLLILSQGVVGMSLNPVKALAAAVMVAFGVGGTVGSGWMASAGAQQPGGTAAAATAPAAQAKPDAEAELKAMRAQTADLQRKLDDATAKLAQAADAQALSRLRAEAAVVQTQAARAEAGAVAQALTPDRLAPPQVMFKTARHEYILTGATGLDAAMLQQLIVDHEARGWEFAGTAPLGDGLACVFRKAATPVAANATSAAPTLFGGRVLNSNVVPSPAPAPTPAVPPRSDTTPAPAMTPTPASKAAKSAPPKLTALSPAEGPGFHARPDGGATMSGMMARAVGIGSPRAAAEAERLQAEISVLQAKLALLKPVPDTKVLTVTFGRDDSVLEPVTLGHLLLDLGQKKFGTGGRITVHVKDGGLSVTGDRQVTDWAAATVKSFKGD